MRPRPAEFLIPALLVALLVLAPQRAHAFDEDAGHNGKIFATVMYNVPLEYAGTVTEVLVRPGDKVKEGQPLIRFKLKDESILAILQYLSLDRTIINTQISLADNEIRITDLNKEYESAKRLSAAQMGSADLLRTLKHNVEQLRDKSRLLAGLMKIDKNELDNRRAIVERKLGVSMQDGNVPESGELLSPMEGEVLLVDPSLRAGGIVPALPAAVTIGRTNPVEVRTRVFEAEIPGLRIGGKATVQVVSLDGVRAGVVSHIDRYPDDMNVDRPSYYNVRIELPNDDDLLRPGFKTVVKFIPEDKNP
ncbi:MAG: efflux RND transporter periplasmic adaptor subunit [Desulfovibrio sp.]|jgi:multidrug efflux pump subunit AcrA (membrane-fusion protein)|nr:efflux RND transporter periplasmic adaptor subunit [Desulfovibrio sp.]